VDQGQALDVLELETLLIGLELLQLNPPNQILVLEYCITATMAVMLIKPNNILVLEVVEQVALGLITMNQFFSQVGVGAAQDNHLLVSPHLRLHLVFHHQINLLSHLLLRPLDSMVAVVVDQVKIKPQAVVLGALEVVVVLEVLEYMELVVVVDQLTLLD
tara:strand:- start:105 stop:584 length:480 start_codon:yes stop_codon:yes gene_type:complete